MIVDNRIIIGKRDFIGKRGSFLCDVGVEIYRDADRGSLEAWAAVSPLPLLVFGFGGSNSFIPWLILVGFDMRIAQGTVLSS